MLWISTVTLMLLIVGGVAALHVLSDVRTSYTVGVVSGDAVEIVGLADGNPDTTVHAARFPELAEAQRAAAAGHLDAVLVQRRPPGSWTVISSGRSNGQLNGVLTAAVQAYVTERNARALGVPLSSLTAGAQVSTEFADGDAEKAETRSALTFVFGVLFFLSCQLFGTAIANSVVEEKESRVVEVLLAAVPTRALLAGKVIGNAVLGIAQMALFTATAVAVARVTGEIPDVGRLAASSGWYLLGYVVGFVTVCCLFAGLGALAPRTQDLPTATAPLQVLLAATYALSVSSSETVLRVASFLPIASTVTLPARIFTGDVPWSHVVISYAVAVAFAAACIPVAARMYRASVLRTDGRVSLVRALRRSDVHPVPPR